MGQEESTMAAAGGPPATLADRTLEAVAAYIKSGNAKRIVVLTGAGISTAAGIPDFRSPKTGLYNNLARLKLPYAEAVFDISYFRNKPEPFYVLAQELYPGKFFPTVSHAFIALLAQKGLLQKLFTQNIDCLERAAGVPPDMIVEAHGSFATQRCIECQVEYPDEDMKEHVLQGQVPRCNICKGLVKPDITFFGEALPRAFSEQSHHTVMADLMLIIGTSLTVYPFASLPDMARQDKPRVLFNMEKVGSLGSRADDVLELRSCDDGIRKLADHLGWRDELEKLWRETVGDKEAERQLRSQQEREEAVEDEVNKLTNEIDAALRFNDSDEDEGDRETDSAQKPADTTRVMEIAKSLDNAPHRPILQNAKPPQEPDLKPSPQDDAANASETVEAAAAAISDPKAEHEEKVPEKNPEAVDAGDCKTAGDTKAGGDAENAADTKPVEGVEKDEDTNTSEEKNETKL
ncbi:NAD-dependent protein deacetylase hst2-1 [Cladobotryum mycophilum]|uniref:NAD-dependent protein deacetylase hst2-1 n=1 Tax=Cladobotryum mycophilum TaxID=491253 RepID=A0ABR0SG55_9HYPO